MKSIQKWTPGLGLLLAVLFSGAPAAQAATPTVFASGIVRPNGITASSTLLLVAPQSCPVASEASNKVCGNADGAVPGPTTIYSLNAGGVATAFTSLETGAVEDQEIYMATAAGGHGWGAGDVYAARGKNVYKIAAGGVSVGAGPLTTHFSVPCTKDNQHVGITFDTVGTFGFSLIITCGEEATTWKVSTAGAATVISGAGVLPDGNNGQIGVTEGPAVTPANFCLTCNLPISYTPLSGSISAVGSKLFVTQENRDEVAAITSGGAASVFNHSNTVRDPEGVLVVPNPACTFSTSGAAYFIADQTNNVIISYPASDFTSIGGNLLIPNEAPHSTDPGHSIYMVNKTTGELTVFDAQDSVPGNATAFINHEGSAFVTCITPPATMPIVKHSTDPNTPPTNADFLFGLYPRNNNTFANPPVGVATTDFPVAFSYDVNEDGVPAGAVRGTLITTPPESGLLIPLANGAFNAAVCELKHTDGWTFSSWTVAFTPNNIAGNAASAAFHPAGETLDPDIECINLTIQPGTTNVALDVFDSPPEQPSGGRFTGGGSFFPTGSNDTPSDITERITHGFELHCDATRKPNNLEVNWAGTGKGKKAENNFHMDNLTKAECIEDPDFNEQHPVAGIDTYEGIGSGKFNGTAGAIAHWIFTDAGEPGVNDEIWMEIWDNTGKLVLRIGSFTGSKTTLLGPGPLGALVGVPGTDTGAALDKGNQQAHK